MSNVIVSLKYESGQNQYQDTNYRDTFELLLEGIQEQELRRLEVIKESMESF